MNPTELEAWLVGRNYRPATVRQTVQQAAAVERAFEAGEPVPEYCRLAAQRIYEFVQANNAELFEYLVDQGISPATKKLQAKPKARVYAAQSVEEDDWGNFQAELEQSDDPRDRVIEVMCVTGMRVGDALRLNRTKIARALKNHEPVEYVRKDGRVVWVPVGVVSTWQRLLALLNEAEAATPAALLSPKNPSDLPADAAYQQINRRLKWWANELNIVGRMHTHRMRRTFAVRLHRATKDITVVAQGLNNGIQASMKYLDESRSDELAGLQQKLRGRV